MNKKIIKYIAIAILLTPMVSFAEPAPASSPASSPVQSPAPSTGESQSTASPATPSVSESVSTASPATPSTGDSSSTATPATPSTGGSTSTATPATPSTGGSSSTAINNTTPINPPVNPPNGGSSSSSSSSSGSRAYVYGCPMLTSYLRYGANNDTAQVAKLQSFLSNYEKMNVSVTGIFDKQTENAVTAFQTKYSADIMGPWNKTYGTGYVYITTLKKINNIACSLPLTLSTTEQAIINEVINKSTVAKTVIVTPNTSNQIEIKGNVDDNTTVLEIELESENTNVAAVSKPSVINKFWNFIKSLF